MAKSPSIADLSFWKDGRWNPTVTGDWARDNATGREYATELIEMMRATENPALLWFVVDGIAEAAGPRYGVVIGFFNAIATAAIGRVGPA